MFALREGSEAAIKQAKDRGMDEQLRTRMQEIGPRFTLKLRWIKRGTMDVGRRRGASGVTGETETANAKLASDNGKGKGRASDMDVDLDADAKADGQMQHAEEEEEAGLSQQDQEDEESARMEMLAQTGQAEETNLSVDEMNPAEPATVTPTALTPVNAAADSAATATARTKSSKRKRRTFSPNGTTLKIPSFTAPKTIDKAELPHHRKLKPGASLLDSLAVTVGYGRGGTRKEKKEWEWDPRMQVSRRRFFL